MCTKPLSISVNLFNHYKTEGKESQPLYTTLLHIYKITPMDYWVKKTAFYWEVSTNSGDTEKFTFPTLEMQGKTIAIYLYPANQLRDSAAGESYKTGG